jgi:hypothetical protein
MDATEQYEYINVSDAAELFLESAHQAYELDAYRKVPAVRIGRSG